MQQRITLKIFSLFRIFEQLALAFKNRVFPQNFHCVEYISYHSRFLINSALTLKNKVCPEIVHCIQYTFYIQDFWATCACPEFAVLNIYIFTVTCGEVRDWGGTVSFKAKFASVWIEWSSINSPLNWLLAEWLLLMLSTPYHNLLNTKMGTMAILDLKKVTYRRTKLKWLVYYLFYGFTEKLKQSYNLCTCLQCMQWSNRECRPSVWSAAAQNFNEICKVKERLRAVLQITSAQQHAPIHVIPA